MTSTNVPFRRATIAMYTDINDNRQTAAIDIIRNAHYIAGILQPPLIEGSATNGVRNSMLLGAIVGTPGTLPTNWLLNTVSGLSTQIVATGTEFGLPYIDIRFFGTSTGILLRISPEATNFIVASNAQLWTYSFYNRLIAGTLNGVTNIYSSLAFRNAANGLVPAIFYTGPKIVPNATLARASVTQSSTDPTTAYISCDVRCDITNGAAIDFTIRLYQPQAEIGSIATSPIQTNGAAITRAADIDQMLSARSNGYDRVLGDFIQEGFIRGMLLTPVGFNSNPSSIIANVFPKFLQVSDIRQVEAAQAGRTLSAVSTGTFRGIGTIGTGHDTLDLTAFPENIPGSINVP